MSMIATATLDAPRAPKTLEDAGLSRDLVTQLVLKILHLSGELTGTELARRLGLPFFSIEPILTVIKQQHQCEISGGALGSPTYRYRITDVGRARAMLFMEHNHYVGYAPVPLRQYRQYMAEFKKSVRSKVGRESVRDAFSHLVISTRVLDQLGPAINGGHSMFVYGPPGNGKTVISQAIHNLLEGEIYIPHALEVEGSIIRFFDPVNHEPVPEAGLDDALDLSGNTDRRWIRCRRPMVMVGGELSLDQLELSYSPTMGFYRAPVQAVSNGGVLVIDDFGRQTCSPRDLLNRWIVPLESRVDFLTLQTGQKFDFPFMTLVVFATNVKPQDLVDEAFLRRIQYILPKARPETSSYRYSRTPAATRTSNTVRTWSKTCSSATTGRGRSSCAAVSPAISSTRRFPSRILRQSSRAHQGHSRSRVCELLRRRHRGAALVRVMSWRCVNR